MNSLILFSVGVCTAIIQNGLPSPKEQGHDILSDQDLTVLPSSFAQSTPAAEEHQRGVERTDRFTEVIILLVILVFFWIGSPWITAWVFELKLNRWLWRFGAWGVASEFLIGSAIYIYFFGGLLSLPAGIAFLCLIQGLLIFWGIMIYIEKLWAIGKKMIFPSIVGVALMLGAMYTWSCAVQFLGESGDLIRFFTFVIVILWAQGIIFYALPPEYKEFEEDIMPRDPDDKERLRRQFFQNGLTQELRSEIEFERLIRSLSSESKELFQDLYFQHGYTEELRLAIQLSQKPPVLARMILKRQGPFLEENSD